MKKYIVIEKTIEGKLVRILEFTNKQEAKNYISKMVDLAYQLTIVAWSIFVTADNFEEERKFCGQKKLI